MDASSGASVSELPQWVHIASELSAPALWGVIVGGIITFLSSFVLQRLLSRQAEINKREEIANSILVTILRLRLILTEALRMEAKGLNYSSKKLNKILQELMEIKARASLFTNPDIELKVAEVATTLLGLVSQISKHNTKSHDKKKQWFTFSKAKKYDRELSDLKNLLRKWIKRKFWIDNSA